MAQAPRSHSRSRSTSGLQVRSRLAGILLRFTSANEATDLLRIYAVVVDRRLAAFEKVVLEFVADRRVEEGLTHIRMCPLVGFDY